MGGASSPLKTGSAHLDGWYMVHVEVLQLETNYSSAWHELSYSNFVCQEKDLFWCVSASPATPLRVWDSFFYYTAMTAQEKARAAVRWYITQLQDRLAWLRWLHQTNDWPNRSARSRRRRRLSLYRTFAGEDNYSSEAEHGSSRIKFSSS